MFEIFVYNINISSTLVYILKNFCEQFTVFVLSVGPVFKQCKGIESQVRVEALLRSICQYELKL